MSDKPYHINGEPASIIAKREYVITIICAMALAWLFGGMQGAHSTRKTMKANNYRQLVEVELKVGKFEYILEHAGLIPAKPMDDEEGK